MDLVILGPFRQRKVRLSYPIRPASAFQSLGSSGPAFESGGTRGATQLNFLYRSHKLRLWTTSACARFGRSCQ